MFDPSELTDELQALKSEVSRLMSIKKKVLSTTRRIAPAFSPIKAALNELGETLSEQESHVEHFISDRPIATLASAFALGECRSRISVYSEVLIVLVGAAKPSQKTWSYDEYPLKIRGFSATSVSTCLQ